MTQTSTTITVDSLPTASTIDPTQDRLLIYTASAMDIQGINRNTFLGLSSQPVGINDSQVLANKTLTSPTINSTAITNATITTDAITGYTSPNVGTVYGLSISSGTISNALSFGSTLAVTGAVTMNSTLAVTGASTLTGNTTINGNAAVGGTLGVTGNTSLANATASGTLGVTGATTLTGAVSTVGQISTQTSTAPPASGATTAGIKMSSTANLGFFYGNGAPTFSAAKGSLYVNTTATTTTTRLYINSSGSTTWTNFTSAA